MFLIEHRNNYGESQNVGMRDFTCEECTRLWRTYSAATSKHLQLEGDLKAALTSGRDAEANGLALILEAAEADRLAAREAIRQHEEQDHTAASEASA